MNQVTKQYIVDTQAALKPSQVSGRIALFNPDGSVLTVVQTPAVSVLTGYVIGANAVVAATDTVNGAFGKVQKQISDHVTALAALDARVDILEA